MTGPNGDAELVGQMLRSTAPRAYNLGYEQGSQDSIRFVLDGLDIVSLSELKEVVDLGVVRRAFGRGVDQLTSEDVIRAVTEALNLSGGASVIYIHEGGWKPAFAAILRADTDEWQAMHLPEKLGGDMINHDHIEPGMF